MGFAQFLRNYTHTHKKIMKLIGLTAALFSGVAYSAFPSSPVGDFEWMAWKQTHSIKFPTRHEESRRYNIFSQNRKFIAAHNERAANGLETYTVGLNKFAAMEHTEFKDLYLSQVRDYSQKQIVMEYQCPNKFVSDGSTPPGCQLCRWRSRQRRCPSHLRQRPRFMWFLLDFRYFRSYRRCPMRGRRQRL